MKSVHVVALATLSFAIAAPLAAQNATWSVGQHVKVFYPLSGGRGMAWRTGVVTEVFGWGVHMRFDDEDRIESFANGDVQSADAAAPAAQMQAAPPIVKTPPRQTAQVPQPPQAGACASDPSVANGGGSLAMSIKHAIYENYAAEINGSLSAPLTVGVTFQSFQIGSVLANNVTRTGYDYPAAARGAPIYPVATRHIYCRGYRNATTRTLFAGSYVCFQSRTGGGMMCGTAAGHRILGYQ